MLNTKIIQDLKDEAVEKAKKNLIYFLTTAEKASVDESFILALHAFAKNLSNKWQKRERTETVSGYIVMKHVAAILKEEHESASDLIKEFEFTENTIKH